MSRAWFRPPLAPSTDELTEGELGRKRSGSPAMTTGCHGSWRSVGREGHHVNITTVASAQLKMLEQEKWTKANGKKRRTSLYCKRRKRRDEEAI